MKWSELFAVNTCDSHMTAGHHWQTPDVVTDGFEVTQLRDGPDVLGAVAHSDRVVKSSDSCVESICSVEGLLFARCDTS